MPYHHNPGYRAAWRRLLRLDLFIGLTCVLLIALMWIATLSRLHFEREQIVENTRSAAAHLALTFEQHTLRALQGAEQLARVIRDDYLQHGQIDLRGWRARGVLPSDGFFDGAVLVLDAQGQVVAHDTDAEPRVADPVLSEMLQIHKGHADAGLHIGVPAIGEHSQWWVPLSMRISRADGSFGGLVLMMVEADQFSQFYPQNEIGQLGGAILVNADGIALVRRVGTQLRYGGDVKASEAYQRYHREPQATYYSKSTVDGNDRILSHRTLSPYGVIVAVGMSVPEALAAFEQRRSVYLRVSGFATLGLALFALVVWMLLRRSQRAMEALRGSEAVFRATFNQAATGVFHATPDGRFLRVNDKFSAMVGYSAARLMDRSMYDIAHPDDEDLSRQRNAQLLRATGPQFGAEIEKRYVRSDGEPLWVSESHGLVVGPDGVPDFLVCLVQDISVRKALQERLAHKATHDPLTELPNRGLLLERLASSLRQSHRRGNRVGVCFIDLDGFKSVNDSLGHARGDLLLQQVARRLKACVREVDTVGRLGGDEFVIVLGDILDAAHCGKVAGKVIDALAKPYELLGAKAVHISASIGIAVSPEDGDDAEVLVNHADAAMYRAKNAGKNAFRFHSELGSLAES